MSIDKSRFWICQRLCFLKVIWKVFAYNRNFENSRTESIRLRPELCSDLFFEYQAWIQHLKEVSQTEKIVVFPFITNSHVFHLSLVSLSEIWCQDHRYASDFLLLLTYVSWTLNLSGKIQILKYWLTVNYFKCIIWGYSIITIQIDQNLDTPSPLICTCLILILYF